MDTPKLAEHEEARLCEASLFRALSVLLCVWNYFRHWELEGEEVVRGNFLPGV